MPSWIKKDDASSVAPENVDCTRAMFKLTEDNMESIRRTDKALGLSRTDLIAPVIS